MVYPNGPYSSPSDLPIISGLMGYDNGKIRVKKKIVVWGVIIFSVLFFALWLYSFYRYNAIAGRFVQQMKDIILAMWIIFPIVLTFIYVLTRTRFLEVGEQGIIISRTKKGKSELVIERTTIQAIDIHYRRPARNKLAPFVYSHHISGNIYCPVIFSLSNGIIITYRLPDRYLLLFKTQLQKYGYVTPTDHKPFSQKIVDYFSGGGGN